jgi:hypothetical protein
MRSNFRQCHTLEDSPLPPRRWWNSDPFSTTKACVNLRQRYEEFGKVDNASQLATKPRSWRLRFTLRLMLALVTLLGIMLGWWTHRAREQQRLVERIMRSKGGAIEYDYPRDPRTDEPLESNVPKFLLDGLGVDYFYNVIEVGTEDPTVLPELTRLDCLNRLAVGNKNWTDKDLAPIAQLRTLTYLHIAMGDNETPLPPIGDPSLMMIAQLPQLESAWVKGTGITARGIEYLSRSTSLRRVHIACADPNLDAHIAETFRRTGRVSYFCIERFTSKAAERLVEWDSARKSSR